MGIIPARIEEIESARGIVQTKVSIPKIAMNESGLDLSVSLLELVQKPRNNDLDYGYDSGVKIVRLMLAVLELRRVRIGVYYF